MTDADYVDDLVPLTNTPAQANSLLYSFKKAVKSIGLHLNFDKTEFMRYKQSVILLNGKPRKLESDSYNSIARSHQLKVMSAYAKI